jgi:Ran GTPase-activating protein (RanGAP) involved in mRNA processing and transport
MVFYKARISSTIFKRILEALAQSHVTELHFEVDTYMDNEENCKVFAEIMPKTKVTKMKFEACKLTDDDIKRLCTAVLCSKVTHLEFSCVSLSNVGITYLSNALNHLTHLRLYDCDFDDEGLMCLSAALATSNIVSLTLINNVNIGYKGYTTLANALPTSHITQLDICGSWQMGDHGATALAEVLPYSQVSILNLSYTKIGDLGAIALAEVLPRCNLLELNLGFCKLSDQGVLALARVLPFTKLKLLLIYGEDLRESEKVIDLALEQCKVLRLMLALRSAMEVKKLGTKSAFRYFPMDMCRCVSEMLL